MKKPIFLLLLLSVSLMTCKKDATQSPDKVITKIAFGSCFLQQFFTPKIFTQIDKKSPDMYLNLGDMIYSDEFFTSNPHDSDWATYLAMRYNELGNEAIFKDFKKKYIIHSTWDDHDFGMNNAAGDFKNKQISKDVFFNFWGLLKSGARWNRNGIYDAFYYGDDAHRLQIIMLDLRWDLSNPGPEPIAVITDSTKKMMSDDQWNWLKDELKVPAKVRILCSSTQFCTEHNGWEAWANFPHEQDRLYQTIKDAKAEGLFIISGDVHIAEVNKRTPAGLYPIWDFTSSGLAQLHGSNTRPSMYRVGASFDKDNFGTLDIDWNSAAPTVKFTAFDTIGAPLLQQTINIGDLKIP